LAVLLLTVPVLSSSMPMPFERVGVAVVTLLVFSLLVFVAVSGVLIHSRSVRCGEKIIMVGVLVSRPIKNVTGAKSRHGRRSVARFLVPSRRREMFSRVGDLKTGLTKLAAIRAYSSRQWSTKYYSTRCVGSLLLNRVGFTYIDLYYY